MANRPPNNKLRDYARYSAIGMQMMTAMLLGAFGGRWLDTRLGTSPFLLLLLLLLGVAYALYIVVRLANNNHNDKK